MDRELHPHQRCRIAIVGKYVQLQDAYLSISEALKHAGICKDARINIEYIDAEEVTEKNADQLLGEMDGIIIPGGFGSRGLSGKQAAITYARTHRVPLLGICLGMQMMAVEFARNGLGKANANTTEVDPSTPDPIIDLMPDQVNNLHNICLLYTSRQICLYRRPFPVSCTLHRQPL